MTAPPTTVMTMPMPVTMMGVTMAATSMAVTSVAVTSVAVTSERRVGREFRNAAPLQAALDRRTNTGRLMSLASANVEP
jgi:hypothetical protein